MPAIKIEKIAPLLGKGIVAEFAPDILKGVFIELVGKRIDLKELTRMVERDDSLWDMMKPEHQKLTKQLARKLGDVGWLDTPWAINALKGDYPAIASLFLGWKRANNWLTRQLEVIKKEVQQAGA